MVITLQQAKETHAPIIQGLLNLNHLLRARMPVRTLLLAPPVVDRAVPNIRRVVVTRPRHLARQLLERLALGLGDEERGEDAAQHEQRKDLHDVVEPGGCGGAWWSAALAQRAEDALRDDGANFAGGGGYAVGGRAVACWEAFAGDDEGSRVGAWGGMLS